MNQTNLKFTALTPALASYIAVHHSGADDPLLNELRSATQALGGIGGMQISSEQGTLLQLLVSAVGARRAIEVGTFTGYSALCIARGLAPGGKLVCCDQSDEWTRIGRPFWQRAGLEETIELRLGDAATTLRNLSPDETFDFAFVDADKSGYDTYYELILPHLEPNALILFDNMLRDGRVADVPAANAPDTNAPAATTDATTDADASRARDDAALRALNLKLAHDERVQAVLLPIADGLQIVRKLA